MASYLQTRARFRPSSGSSSWLQQRGAFRQATEPGGSYLQARPGFRDDGISAPPPAAGFAPAGYTLAWFDEFDTYSVANWNQVGEGTHAWVPYFIGWGVRNLSGNSDDGQKCADYEVLRDPPFPLTVNQLLTTDGTYAGTNLYGRYMHDVTPAGTMLMRAYKVPVSLAGGAGPFFGFPYIGAMISTERTYNQGSGYFEIRFRIVKFFQGLHFSIWMLADDLSYPPEIDILEVLGHEPEIWYHNIIGLPGSHLQSHTVADYAEWHTLGFLRTATELKWSLDGVLFRTEANYLSPPDKPMYFLATYEIAGNWEGNPSPTAPWPAVFEVDYARAYLPVPTAPPVSLSPSVIAPTTPVNLGTVLTVTPGGWSDPPLLSYRYQWRRGGSNISGATTSSYTVTATDVGAVVGCRVWATNALGESAGPALSNGVTPT